MRVADLSWPDFAAQAPGSIIVLPVGALEPHGPHLPLGTDSAVAAYLAGTLDAEPDVLVLPPIGYGRKTSPRFVGGEFPGTVWLKPVTLMNVIADVLTAAYESGARRFAIVGAHIANVPVVEDAVELLRRRAPLARCIAVNWWDLTSESTRTALARATGVPRELDHHAAMAETSLMLAIAPAHVHADLIGDEDVPSPGRYLVAPTAGHQRTRAGTVYRAKGASAGIGAELLAEITVNLLQVVRAELGKGQEDSRALEGG